MTLPISTPEAVLRGRLAHVAEQADMPLTIRQVERLALEATLALAPLLITTPPRTPHGHYLTPAQMCVLVGMANGLENAEIARRAARTEATVKSHTRRVLQRLGARNRTHAVAIALATGTVPTGCVQSTLASPSSTPHSSSWEGK